MNSHEEEEDDGPSVDSEVAEERIAARRLRIQRRQEAARRYIDRGRQDRPRSGPVIVFENSERNSSYLYMIN